MLGSRIRRSMPAIAGFAVLLLALVPIAIGAASPYPPNTVVSTYFDPRFCGNGQVSVVSDSGGNLIDICAASGQRIDGAAFAGPGYGYGYLPSNGVGIIPPYTTGVASPVFGGGGNVIREYTDGNANCPNGDVTQTLSGFYCTLNGQPAASSLSAPIYTGDFGAGLPGYGGIAYGAIGNGAYGAVGNGAFVRQYNDGRSNCPNGDVTETTTGFFCTANGHPAFRTT